jgi:hypothetical protein
MNASVRDSFVSNVYRKLLEAEVTLLLRIVNRSKPVSLSAAGLRSHRLKPRRGGLKILWPVLTRRRLSQSLLLWLPVLAALLCPPSARASFDFPEKNASASAWSMAQSDPAALVRFATQNEFNNSYGHRPPLRYQVRKVTQRSDTTKQIVETRDGGVARLIAIGNKPLTDAQEQAEIERLRRLSTDRTSEEHRRHSEERDAERIGGVMHLLPEAFLYQLKSPENSTGLIRLSFTPNPRFSPPTLESRVLTGIHGDIWIDAQDLRVVRIEGQLYRTVDYGWGILGTLYPGGTIRIEQTKTTGCGWQLAHLTLHLVGKELLFKALHIQLDEFATDYHSVPSEWKYTDAIQWLLQTPINLAAQINP